MAVQTLTGPPSSFPAGDTVRFTVSDSDHPATAWTLRFLMRSPAGTLTEITGAASGNDFTVTIPATTILAPGTYALSNVFTETATSERETVRVGLCHVSPNPSAEIEKSTARKTLEAMEAALLKLSSGTNNTVSINGQTFTKRDLAALQNAIDRQRLTVMSEDRANGISARGGAVRIISRF